ncbi:MAG: hypothetical protein FJ034_02450 [Chloroflexi bacterium]|nr:hypothetical protein [Chloroflexota bacterium]
MRVGVVAFMCGLLVGLAVAGARTSPESLRWSDEAPLARTRTYAQAVALPNGKVLIEGGIDRRAASVLRYESEIFDPRTGRSRLIEVPGESRMWQTLTTLRDGRVLSAGGVSRDQREWFATPAATLFDPLTERYVPVAPLTQARSDHGAVLLPDARVLVAGGHDGPKFLRGVEIYDPLRDRWDVTTPMPKGRSQFTMSLLPDGRVLLAGGFLEPGDPTDTSVLYDPRTRMWSDGPLLTTPRALHAAVTLPDGDLLFIGGQRGAAGTAERYRWRTNEFLFAGTLSSPRMYSVAGRLDDGSVVTVGGFLRPESGEGFVPTALAERWDPLTNQWSPVAPARTARAAAAAVVTRGRLLLLGGSAEGDEALDSVEVFR